MTTLTCEELASVWRAATPLTRVLMSATISCRISLSEIASLCRQQLLRGSFQGFPVVMWVTSIEEGREVQFALPRSLVYRMLSLSDPGSEYIFADASGSRPTVSQLTALLHLTQVNAGIDKKVERSRFHMTPDQQYRAFVRHVQSSCSPLFAEAE